MNEACSKSLTSKNIYTVRVLDSGDLPAILSGTVGKLEYLIVVQKDAQWSAEAVIPDFSVTDQFDLDIIFDDEFRKITEVNVGDIFNVDFSIADKKAGLREAQVLNIRKDKPINHLQNKEE